MNLMALVSKDAVIIKIKFSKGILGIYVNLPNKNLKF